MNPTLVLVICIVPAALYVLWPLFVSDSQEAMAETRPDPIAELEQAKNTAYAAIKEAEFDRRTGKLDDEDYESLVRRYKDQALQAIAALDARRLRRDPPPVATFAQEIRFCPGCGTKSVPAAKFCGGCGAALAA